MTNASVYVGSDPTSVYANKLVAVRASLHQCISLELGAALGWRAAAGQCPPCSVPADLPAAHRHTCPCRCLPACPQSGLSLAAGQQIAVEGRGVMGRYVIIYTGLLSEVRLCVRLCVCCSRGCVCVCVLCSAGRCVCCCMLHGVCTTVRPACLPAFLSARCLWNECIACVRHRLGSHHMYCLPYCLATLPAAGRHVFG